MVNMILVLLIFSSCGLNNNKNIDDKISSEILYIDSKTTELLSNIVIDCEINGKVVEQGKDIEKNKGNESSNTTDGNSNNNASEDDENTTKSGQSISETDGSTKSELSESETNGSTKSKSSESEADGSTKSKSSESEADSSTKSKSSESEADSSTKNKSSESEADSSIKSESSESETERSTKSKATESEDGSSSESKLNNTEEQSSSERESYNFSNTDTNNVIYNYEWDEIKKGTEELYISWSTIKSDLLLKKEISQEDLDRAGNDIDNMILDVVNKDRAAYTKHSSNLYTNINFLLEKINYDRSKLNIMRVKQKVYEASYYVLVDNWSEVEKSIRSCNNTIENNSDINEEIKNILKDIEASIITKDRKIFFIKTSELMNKIKYFY